MSAAEARRVLGLTTAASLAAILSACAPPSIETLKGVTVIAVQANPPSAHPGETVHLELTAFDATAFRDRERAADNNEVSAATTPLNILWFGGCHNPPGETPLACLSEFGPLAEAAETAQAGMAPENPELLSQFGFGPSFDLQIPEGSVQDRARSKNLVPFGTSYAFFAVCRGTLEPRPEERERIPIACVDRDGNDVEEEDAVIGYTTVYVFDELQNQNPEVSGVLLDEERVESAACSDNQDCTALGERLRYECFEARCLPSVSACGNDCTALSLAPVVPARAAELDPSSVVIGAEPPPESLWVRYYALGRLDRVEASIGNRSRDFKTSFAAHWTPPARALALPVPLWTVVQDNRGGSTPRLTEVLIR